MMTGVPAGIDTTTSRPEPARQPQVDDRGDRAMQLNHIDRIVGGLRSHHLEVVHLQEFLEGTAHAVVVFDHQNERQCGSCHPWSYRSVRATSSK